MLDMIFPRLSRVERIRQRQRMAWSDLFVTLQLWFSGFIAATAVMAIVIAGIPGCRQHFQSVVNNVSDAGLESAVAAISMDGFAAANGLLKVSEDMAIVDRTSDEDAQGLYIRKSYSAQTKPNLNLPNKSIVINLPSRILDFYSGNTLIKEYPVAIGKPSTVTPMGSYTVIYKEINPAWYPPGKHKVIPSGPDNPLGYRWIGFAPLYGVHGTNAPAFIGAAVSNGCVRMNEADVEELFETVPEGTPVRLTYELTRVKLENNGQVTVGVYPDVYGYKNNQVTLAEIKDKLAALGWDGFAGDDILEQVIKERSGRQIPVIQLHKIKINGEMVQAWAVLWQDTVLVPAWPVATALKEDVVWNEADQTVASGSRTVPGFIKGDVLYITAENAQVLFGGFRLWHPQENYWEFVLPSLSRRK